MLTADTITDEQILRMRDQAIAYGDDETRATCARALNAGHMWATHEIAKARARCAEILNTRKERS